MGYDFDTKMTLSQLEGKQINNQKFESGLIQKCYKLYDKPLANYTVEDMRLMIGQDIGLKYLIPMAIEELELNPMVSGDSYAGDLLHSVINSDPEFWKENEAAKNKIEDIIKDTISILQNTLEKFKSNNDK